MLFRRLLICLMAGIFLFETSGFSLIASRINPKTCCGRAICLCTHAKGAQCPLKSRVNKSVKKGSHCHLAGAKQISVSAAGKTSQSERSGFSQAPCHKESRNAAAPACSHDFDLTQAQPLWFENNPQPLKLFERISPLFSAAPGIDHPPRIF